MKRLLLFFVLLLSTQSVFAGIVCPIREGRYWYPRLKAMPISDKSMHCALSCHLTLRCSPIESWSFGRFKEFWDLFGEGDAEWEDLRANDRGMSLALRGQAKNMGECLRTCVGVYPL